MGALCFVDMQAGRAPSPQVEASVRKPGELASEFPGGATRRKHARGFRDISDAGQVYAGGR